jgi:hypothetical protein
VEGLEVCGSNNTVGCSAHFETVHLAFNDVTLEAREVFNEDFTL